MNLQQLEFLVALSETKTYAAAADGRFITAQGFSKSIKKLEKELGAELVSRKEGRICLTPFAESIVPKALEIIKARDEIIALAQKESD